MGIYEIRNLQLRAIFEPLSKCSNLQIIDLSYNGLEQLDLDRLSVILNTLCQYAQLHTIKFNNDIFAAKPEIIRFQKEFNDVANEKNRTACKALLMCFNRLRIQLPTEVISIITNFSRYTVAQQGMVGTPRLRKDILTIT